MSSCLFRQNTAALSKTKRIFAACSAKAQTLHARLHGAQSGTSIRASVYRWRSRTRINKRQTARVIRVTRAVFCSTLVGAFLGGYGGRFHARRVTCLFFPCKHYTCARYNCHYRNSRHCRRARFWRFSGRCRGGRRFRRVRSEHDRYVHIGFDSEF